MRPSAWPGAEIRVDVALDDHLFMASGRVFDTTCSTVGYGHTLRITQHLGGHTFGVVDLETEETCSATQLDCRRAILISPEPFQGNGGEEIVLDDQTVWGEVSYQYLYLYKYRPSVYICPAARRMVMGDHVFKVFRKSP